MQELTVDPEFRDKIPPLTEDEFVLLAENILSDGAVLSPLIVWNGVILDGHNRYEIIQKHPKLAYTIHEVVFDNRFEALSWICKNQLGRRNLTPQQKKYLIGQRYEAEKKANFYSGNQYTLTGKSGVDKVCPPHKQHGTRSRIAKEASVSEGFVQNAANFAKGVDAAEEALPGIKQEILTGAIKPAETAVSAIARAEPSERPRLAAALKKPKESDQKMPAYHLPSSQSKREVLRQIRAISAEMEQDKPPITEADILRTLAAEVDSFIELCDHTFLEYPALLAEKQHRQRLMHIMQKLSRYIIEIGGHTK